jgi:leucine dehydrogenase
MGSAGAEVSCAQEDPSPWTALGVFAAIRAAVAATGISDDVRGLRILIQGVGHVGEPLARRLASNGARLLLCDADPVRAEKLAQDLGGTVVDVKDAVDTACEVFAPCALARIIDAEAVNRFKCLVIAGAANDTLAEAQQADRLAKRGITYVPDFVANAGGVIHIHAVRSSWNEMQLNKQVLAIGQRVKQILTEASQRDVTPLIVAEERAAERLESAARA